MTLVLSDVTKVFMTSGGAQVHAVDRVSFDFHAGRLYTILGPSGCGKTTLLRMVAGFEHPTAGDISYDGTRINDVPPYRRGFPMVFQSYALFPHMSVLDNVAYGLRVRGVAVKERRERARRMLELLGLEVHARHYPAQLSGGQQQRVALARALVLEPRMILLDEPLSNLDAGLRTAMRGEIRALQQRLGITAIYVTHDQEEALAISDEVVVMNRGRIEQAASPVEVYQRPASEFVARFMGCPNILPLERADGGIIICGREFTVQGVPAATRVMLRTDAFTIGAAGVHAHAALVTSAAFLGSRTRYVLRTPDGTDLTADAPSRDSMFAAGDAVSFDVRPDGVYCF